MTLNPALIQHGGQTLPQLYPQEQIVLHRGSVDAEFGGVNGQTWRCRGVLFLTNLRLAFLAEKRDHVTGCEAFDVPLVWARNVKFNQPIFFCNNLAGEVWSTAEQGGPNGGLPPHNFVLYFKNGVGTFLPLFYNLLEKLQGAHQNRLQSHEEIQASVATAFIDPSDCSVIHLTQPDNVEGIPTAPKYAPNYGADEQYEEMQG